MFLSGPSAPSVVGGVWPGRRQMSVFLFCRPASFAPGGFFENAPPDYYAFLSSTINCLFDDAACYDAAEKVQKYWDAWNSMNDAIDDPLDQFITALILLSAGDLQRLQEDARLACSGGHYPPNGYPFDSSLPD